MCLSPRCRDFKTDSTKQQQQFITKKSEGQQRSGERKGKSSGTQRGIWEKVQEKTDWEEAEGKEREEASKTDLENQKPPILLYTIV